MNTISRKECIALINNYLQYNSVDSALKLVSLYLDKYDSNDINGVIQLLISNPLLLSNAIIRVLPALESRFKLVELSKNNNPILVY